MSETPPPPPGTGSSPPDAKASTAPKTEAPATVSSPPGSKTPKPRNPIWRMMGIPNIKLKLPSRNWLIFLSITGSFTGTLFYDKYAKKKIQQKWCNLVSHLADEPLDPSGMPRKVTVVLSAPPGDGLSPARDHFREYVKPILVAAAIDWEIIEGRREGDVQRGIAERVRRTRRKTGDGTPEYVDPDEKQAMKDALSVWKKSRGIDDYDGVKGDIVLGRHTWKEYIRGLHEGWLGPVDPPAPAAPAASEFAANEPASEDTPHSSDSETAKAQDATLDASAEPAPTPEAPKPMYTPFISTSDYSNARTPPSLPSSFDPSEPVPFPHILGFFNTPTRLYRFLTRRRVADEVGRQVACIVLNNGQEKWDYQYKATSHGNMEDDQRMDGTGPNTIQGALEHEEHNWRKNDTKSDKEGQERVWLNEIVLDPRIAGRMTKFAPMPPEEEERARRIAAGQEGPIKRVTPADLDEM